MSLVTKYYCDVCGNEISAGIGKTELDIAIEQHAGLSYTLHLHVCKKCRGAIKERDPDAFIIEDILKSGLRRKAGLE